VRAGAAGRRIEQRDRNQEASMTSRNKSRAKTEQTAVAAVRRRDALIGAAAITAGAFALTAPSGVLAQGAIAFVKVDVSVVGKGYRVSKLTGQNVVNDKNEKIGSVDDFVIGQDKALFVVLQVGGFLGIGSKLVVVKYDDLKIDDTGRRIELPGATKDQLKGLAEFRYLT
jgi:sporulation protein YlmC with PRC-barrel domain